MSIVKIIVCSLILVLYSCSTIPKSKNEILTVNELAVAKKYTDSLRLHGVDTILIFYKGCSGCSYGVNKVAYIFWKQNSQNLVAKISSYSVYNNPVNSDDVIGYYLLNYLNIGGKLNEPDMSMISYHYGYSSIQLKIKDRLIFDVKLPDYYRMDSNLEKGLLKWIYYIEGSLFNIEYNDMNWN